MSLSGPTTLSSSRRTNTTAAATTAWDLADLCSPRNRGGTKKTHHALFPSVLGNIVQQDDDVQEGLVGKEDAVDHMIEGRMEVDGVVVEQDDHNYHFERREEVAVAGAVFDHDRTLLSSMVDEDDFQGPNMRSGNPAEGTPRSAGHYVEVEDPNQSGRTPTTRLDLYNNENMHDDLVFLNQRAPSPRSANDSANVHDLQHQHESASTTSPQNLRRVNHHQLQQHQPRQRRQLEELELVRHDQQPVIPSKIKSLRVVLEDSTQRFRPHSFPVFDATPSEALSLVEKYALLLLNSLDSYSLWLYNADMQLRQELQASHLEAAAAWQGQITVQIYQDGCTPPQLLVDHSTSGGSVVRMGMATRTHSTSHRIQQKEHNLDHHTTPNSSSLVLNSNRLRGSSSSCYSHDAMSSAASMVAVASPPSRAAASDHLVQGDHLEDLALVQCQDVDHLRPQRASSDNKVGVGGHEGDHVLVRPEQESSATPTTACPAIEGSSTSGVPSEGGLHQQGVNSPVVKKATFAKKKLTDKGRLLYYNYNCSSTPGTNYLKRRVVKLQRWLKRVFWNPCSALSIQSMTAMEKLFYSHCERCNTNGLNWDLILLHPDPDFLLQEILKKTQLLPETVGTTTMLNRAATTGGGAGGSTLLGGANINGAGGGIAGAVPYSSKHNNSCNMNIFKNNSTPGNIIPNDPSSTTSNNNQGLQQHQSGSKRAHNSNNKVFATSSAAINNHIIMGRGVKKKTHTTTNTTSISEVLSATTKEHHLQERHSSSDELQEHHTAAVRLQQNEKHQHLPQEHQEQDDRLRQEQEDWRSPRNVEVDADHTPVAHGSVYDDEEAASPEGGKTPAVLLRPAEDCSEIPSPREGDDAVVDDAGEGNHREGTRHVGGRQTREAELDEDDHDDQGRRGKSWSSSRAVRCTSMLNQQETSGAAAGATTSHRGPGFRADHDAAGATTSHRGPGFRADHYPSISPEHQDHQHQHQLLLRTSSDQAQRDQIGFQRDLVERIRDIEDELYVLKKCNLIYMLATLEKQSHCLYQYAFIRGRIRKIVLTIGDAFKKRLEQVLAGAAATSGGSGGSSASGGGLMGPSSSGHSTTAAGVVRGDFTGAPTSAVGAFGASNGGGAQEPSSTNTFFMNYNNNLASCSPRPSAAAAAHQQQLQNNLTSASKLPPSKNGGGNSSSSSNTKSGHTFHSVVQVYKLITQVVEAYTCVFSKVGGCGSAIELRALSNAEALFGMPNMVERVYSSILSDVMEYIEGCLTRFEYLYRSSVLCRKVREIFPHTRFPLDIRLSDHRFYSNGWKTRAASATTSTVNNIVVPSTVRGRAEQLMNMNNQQLQIHLGTSSAEQHQHQVPAGQLQNSSSTTTAKMVSRRQRKLLLNSRALQYLKSGRKIISEDSTTTAALLHILRGGGQGGNQQGSNNNSSRGATGTTTSQHASSSGTIGQQLQPCSSSSRLMRTASSQVAGSQHQEHVANSIIQSPTIMFSNNSRPVGNHLADLVELRGLPPLTSVGSAETANQHGQGHQGTHTRNNMNMSSSSTTFPDNLNGNYCPTNKYNTTTPGVFFGGGGSQGGDYHHQYGGTSRNNANNTTSLILNRMNNNDINNLRASNSHQPQEHQLVALQQNKNLPVRVSSATEHLLASRGEVEEVQLGGTTTTTSVENVCSRSRYYSVRAGYTGSRVGGDNVMFNVDPSSNDNEELRPTSAFQQPSVLALGNGSGPAGNRTQGQQLALTNGSAGEPQQPPNHDIAGLKFTSVPPERSAALALRPAHLHSVPRPLTAATAQTKNYTHLLRASGGAPAPPAASSISSINNYASSSSSSQDLVVLRLFPWRNMNYSLVVAEKPTALWRTVYKKAMRYYALDYLQLELFGTGTVITPEEPISNLLKFYAEKKEIQLQENDQNKKGGQNISSTSSSASTSVSSSSSSWSSTYYVSATPEREQHRLYYSVLVTRPERLSTADRVSLDLIRILEEDYTFTRETMQLSLDIPQEYLCLPHQEASKFIADMLILPFEILVPPPSEQQSKRGSSGGSKSGAFKNVAGGEHGASGRATTGGLSGWASKLGDIKRFFSSSDQAASQQQQQQSTSGHQAVGVSAASCDFTTSNTCSGGGNADFQLQGAGENLKKYLHGGGGSGGGAGRGGGHGICSNANVEEATAASSLMQNNYQEHAGGAVGHNHVVSSPNTHQQYQLVENPAQIFSGAHTRGKNHTTGRGSATSSAAAPPQSMLFTSDWVSDQRSTSCVPPFTSQSNVVAGGGNGNSGFYMMNNNYTSSAASCIAATTGGNILGSMSNNKYMSSSTTGGALAGGGGGIGGPIGGSGTTTAGLQVGHGTTTTTGPQGQQGGLQYNSCASSSSASGRAQHQGCSQGQGPADGSSSNKMKMNKNRKYQHRFYFRNSHFRRCVSVECDYSEFTAWLQFLQHLRRGNRVRQADLLALNARITFVNVHMLCAHIRHLSTKIELFRSLTFGNYVPPGLNFTASSPYNIFFKNSYSEGGYPYAYAYHGAGGSSRVNMDPNNMTIPAAALDQGFVGALSPYADGGYTGRRPLLNGEDESEHDKICYNKMTSSISLPVVLQLLDAPPPTGEVETTQHQQEPGFVEGQLRKLEDYMLGIAPGSEFKPGPAMPVKQILLSEDGDGSTGMSVVEVEDFVEGRSGDGPQDEVELLHHEVEGEGRSGDGPQDAAVVEVEGEGRSGDGPRHAAVVEVEGEGRSGDGPQDEVDGAANSLQAEQLPPLQIDALCTSSCDNKNKELHQHGSSSSSSFCSQSPSTHAASPPPSSSHNTTQLLDHSFRTPESKRNNNCRAAAAIADMSMSTISTQLNTSSSSTSLLNSSTMSQRLFFDDVVSKDEELMPQEELKSKMIIMASTSREQHLPGRGATSSTSSSSSSDRRKVQEDDRKVEVQARTTKESDDSSLQLRLENNTDTNDHDDDQHEHHLLRSPDEPLTLLREEEHDVDTTDESEIAKQSSISSHLSRHDLHAREGTTCPSTSGVAHAEQEHSLSQDEMADSASQLGRRESVEQEHTDDNKSLLATGAPAALLLKERHKNKSIFSRVHLYRPEQCNENKNPGLKHLSSPRRNDANSSSSPIDYLFQLVPNIFLSSSAAQQEHAHHDECSTRSPSSVSSTSAVVHPEGEATTVAHLQEEQVKSDTGNIRTAAGRETEQEQRTPAGEEDEENTTVLEDRTLISSDSPSSMVRTRSHTFGHEEGEDTTSRNKNNLEEIEISPGNPSVLPADEENVHIHGRSTTDCRDYVKQQLQKRDKQLEDETRLVHYRGTPNVITAYVLGATGSSTTTALKNVADTWLIQKVVSTATTAGGKLWIPELASAGASSLSGSASSSFPVPLKHYTFKVDPMRGGLHVIRQHPAGTGLATTHSPSDYVLAPSLGTSLAVSIGVQTGLGLLRNLWWNTETEVLATSSTFSGVTENLALDAGKGACVGGCYWAILQAINAAQGSTLAPLRSGASLLALNPTPALLTILGSGWIAVRYFAYTRKWLSEEQFLADAVFSGYSNGCGATACLVGASLGFSPAMCAIVGCLAGSSLACYTYELWREESTQILCKKLRKLAVLVLGLPLESFTEKQVQTRYRTLARYCHPDRNKNPDAQQMFELIQLAKEICMNELNDYKEAKQRLNQLWLYLDSLEV